MFKLLPTSKYHNRKFSEAVQHVTGQPARSAGPVTSDGGSFLIAGIPATTVGTLDTRLRETGFHGPTDNLGRVVMERLPMRVEILLEFLKERWKDQPVSCKG